MYILQVLWCNIISAASLHRALLLKLPELVPIERIRVSPPFLRRLDESTVVDLAKSIQSNGLLQPILVRPLSDGYGLVFGHHRLEACKRLGWAAIPVMIKEMSSEECFLTKIVENIQRNVEIDPLVEAKGYVTAIEHGWTINSIAERIGKSDSYVSDRIGLVRRLDDKVAKVFCEDPNGHLKPSHLELLARIRSKAYQYELSELIQRKRLSVRKLELLISSSQPLKTNIGSDQDSLYVRIPSTIAQKLGLQAGSQVYLYTQSKRRMVIETVRACCQNSLRFMKSTDSSSGA